MATATWKAGKSLIPVIGLLVLAGPALAQLDCPLPEGVTPPPPLPVTAQEVEGGSASLADFALAAKEQYENDSRDITPVRQSAYTNCLVRQEGSPWRSGSTYLVLLTPDGRVFVHAKDMSLSGRQLKPVLYGAVLHAVGIDPAAQADPAAVFPRRLRRRRRREWRPVRRRRAARGFRLRQHLLLGQLAAPGHPARRNRPR